MWLFARRLKVRLGGAPEFFIHTEPAVFFKPWKMDYDAVHWVSLWDLPRSLPGGCNLYKVALPFQGLSRWFWQNFLLLFVEIRKN